jgi:methionyl-tRNA formyltransferase
MKKCSDSVLFIGDCSYWSTVANSFLISSFETVDSIFWESGMAFQEFLHVWKGDWILSFKSDLLLDRDILGAARKGAVNFHPSPPKYRGIGGYFYAVENRDSVFGVTCHHMDGRIDHGTVIAVQYFKLLPSDEPATLRSKAAVYCVTLFNDIIAIISKNEPLPVSKEQWGDCLYTKKALKSFILEHDMLSI